MDKKASAPDTGLASSGEVQELIDLIPHMEEAFSAHESLLNTKMSELKSIQSELANYIESIDSFEENLRGAPDLFDDADRFRSAASREEYKNSIIQALEGLPKIDTAHIEEMAALKEAKKELSKSIASRKALLNRIAELLPKHQNKEIGIHYENAKNRHECGRFIPASQVVYCCCLPLLSPH